MKKSKILLLVSFSALVANCILPVSPIQSATPAVIELQFVDPEGYAADANMSFYLDGTDWANPFETGMAKIISGTNDYASQVHPDC